MDIPYIKCNATALQAALFILQYRALHKASHKRKTVVLFCSLSYKQVLHQKHQRYLTQAADKQSARFPLTDVF